MEYTVSGQATKIMNSVTLWHNDETTVIFIPAKPDIFINF